MAQQKHDCSSPRHRFHAAYAFGLEPSVAQPPLPLQLFLPLQPLSPVEQPPVPLQLFLPLQECLAGGVLSWPM